MSKITFNQSSITKALRKGERCDYSFANGPCLELRINTSKGGSWRWRGRVKVLSGGKSPLVRMTLGPLALLESGKPCPRNMRRAWEDASNCDSLAAKGINPLVQAKEGQSAYEEAKSVNDLWLDYSASCGAISLLAARSQEECRRVYRLHIRPVLGDRKAASISHADCRNFFHEQQRIGRSGGQRLAVLSGIMGEAVRQGVIERNPCKGAKESAPRLRPNKERVRLRSSDVDRLLAASYDVGLRQGLMVELAATTGLRKSNILYARWEWLKQASDGNPARLDIPSINMKGRKSHSVAISPALWQRLQQYRNQSGVSRLKGLIFPSPFDAERPLWKVGRWWKAVREDSGLQGLRWHDLRHYVGSEMARRGVPAQVIKRQLAHSDIATTMRYIDEVSLAGAAADASLKLAASHKV